jgi:hypothetical protein
VDQEQEPLPHRRYISVWFRNWVQREHWPNKEMKFAKREPQRYDRVKMVNNAIGTRVRKNFNDGHDKFQPLSSSWLL